jgi:hypothetical protein
MKTTFLLPLRFAQNGARRIPMGLVVALAVTLVHLNATAVEVDLGTANNFAVLAGSAISDAGGSTITTGNVGLSPTTGAAITGLTAGQVDGTIYAVDAFGPAGSINNPGLLTTAKNDLTTAYNTAFGLPVTETLTGTDLGGLTLTPGVYFFASSAQLTGKLTLNDEGNPDAVFVFQIGSTLTTASSSQVFEELNATGTPASNPGISVFWQVGKSATLGTGTDFEGNILASTTITDDGGSTVLGRLLAETAAVNLNDTTITAPPAEVIGGGGGENVPDTGSTLLLLGFGVATLFAFKALSAWQRSGSLIAGGAAHPAI